MQILLVVAPVFATNCSVVVAGAEGRDADCVVVDAGAGVAPDVERLVAERGLVPRAVVATHGHVDHTWDAAALCERYDVPFRIHPADAYRLADPFGTLGLAAVRDGGDPGVSGALAQALAATGRRAEDYRAPAVVEPLDLGPDGEGALAAGAVRLRTLHAPGHTEGSTLLVVRDGDHDGDSGGDHGGDHGGGVVLAGDVLFAGGVGRTDLPGGDAATMARTLRDVVGALGPELGVVPGHGPTTTVGRELATNPFLRPHLR
ncbi:MBL fold metallo-hydrolase [Isoptericola sp. NPDC056134]|uniref:MBL fold metallo-hydrolase n=2 Tax=unclassified Isoptericola TaxID=2623355 RepID=UPI0035E70F43